MATALDAASARVACALASITDLVVVSNLDRGQCTMDIEPDDAMAAGKKFSDYGIQDAQMAFLQDAIGRCCPENAVRAAVRAWVPIPASTQIVPVVSMLEAEILKIVGWNGQCMSPECCTG